MSTKALSTSAALLLVVAAGCSKEPKVSIEAAQASLSKRSSDMHTRAEFTCGPGE